MTPSSTDTTSPVSPVRTARTSACALRLASSHSSANSAEARNSSTRSSTNDSTWSARGTASPVTISGAPSSVDRDRASSATLSTSSRVKISVVTRSLTAFCTVGSLARGATVST